MSAIPAEGKPDANDQKLTNNVILVLPLQAKMLQ